MSKLCNDINVCWEKRLCSVNGQIGYFHCWEHWANVVDAAH